MLTSHKINAHIHKDSEKKRKRHKSEQPDQGKQCINPSVIEEEKKITKATNRGSEQRKEKNVIEQLTKAASRRREKQIVRMVEQRNWGL